MRSTDPSNARLLAVNQAGGGDGYNAPSGAGAEKWAGDVGVWYEVKRQLSTGQAGQNVVVWRTVVVRQELAIAWEEGDVLTFQPSGQPEASGSVQAVDGDLNPPPGSGGEVTLTLQVT